MSFDIDRRAIVQVVSCMYAWKYALNMDSHVCIYTYKYEGHVQASDLSKNQLGANAATQTFVSAWNFAPLSKQACACAEPQP